MRQSAGNALTPIFNFTISLSESIFSSIPKDEEEIQFRQNIPDPRSPDGSSLNPAEQSNHVSEGKVINVVHRKSPTQIDLAEFKRRYDAAFVNVITGNPGNWPRVFPTKGKDLP